MKGLSIHEQEDVAMMAKKNICSVAAWQVLPFSYS